MELYVPRRILRETAKLVKTEALPDSEEIDRLYYQLDPIHREQLNQSKYQFRLSLLYHYMNNFHSYVPDDKPPFRSYYRMLCEESGKKDVLHKDYDGTDQNSDLYLNQTWGETLELIEAVFVYNSLPVDQINLLRAPGSFGHPLPMNKMGSLLFPSFVHLVALGYNSADLLA